MMWPHRIAGLGGALIGLALLSATALAQPPSKPSPRPPSPAPGPGAPPSPPGPGAPGLAPAPPVARPAPRAGAGTIRTGTLAAGDPKLESGEYYDEYPIQASSGEEIIAVVTSFDFDPYLILIDPSGQHTDNDDFGDSPDVSLIEIPIGDQPGAWRIRVTTYQVGETGPYALMTGTRPADGIDRGGEGGLGQESPEDFQVKSPIALGGTINGTLGEDDPTRQDGSYYEAYSLEAPAGTRVSITMESKDFDTYLSLLSPSGEQESNDDDGAEGSTNSKIETTLGEAGRWLIVANTLRSGETGNYRLTVTRK